MVGSGPITKNLKIVDASVGWCDWVGDLIEDKFMHL